MKNYILLLCINLALFSSCTLKKDEVTVLPAEKKALLIEHQWKGIDMTIYLNDQPNGTSTLKGLRYSFKGNNQFILKKNGQIINEGTWQLLNISNQTVLKLTYQNNESVQIIEDYDISILTRDHLQLSIYSSDSQNNSIQKDYFFSK